MCKNIEEKLFLLSDTKYAEFQSRLMPTVTKDKIIGVRTPALRRLASSIKGSEEAKAFLRELPHKYYEEDNLHAFLIEHVNDFDTALVLTNSFLPYIDNWATCDSFTPRVFKKNKDRLLAEIDKWLLSEHTYTVRYAIKLFMTLYLDNDYKREYMDKVAAVKSEEYYIKMMIAWYFATALAKQYADAFGILKNGILDTWTHNKAIAKATESYRISKETKELLKTLKR